MLHTDNASSLPRKASGPQLKGLFEDTLPCLEAAKARPQPVAIQQDSKEVVGNPVSVGINLELNHDSYTGIVCVWIKHTVIIIGVQEVRQEALTAKKCYTEEAWKGNDCEMG